MAGEAQGNGAGWKCMYVDDEEDWKLHHGSAAEVMALFDKMTIIIGPKTSVRKMRGVMSSGIDTSLIHLVCAVE